MAAEIHFAFHDARGSEILDELEERTGVSPNLKGAFERRYHLNGAGVSAPGFDEVLDLIDPAWRDHLRRTP